MVGIIVVVDAQTHCALLHSVCDLKAAQMSVQHSQNHEFILYKFELGHNIMEATKNICCMKGEGAIDHRTVTKWLRKFYLGCKKLDNQARSDMCKIVDSKAMFQALRVYQVSLAYYSSLLFIIFITLAKQPGKAKLCITLPKYCKNFDSPE